MILDIHFTTPDHDRFETCATLLERKFSCPVLKKSKYLTDEQLLRLLPLDLDGIFEYIARSGTNHGFIYRGKLYVHPGSLEVVH